MADHRIVLRESISRLYAWSAVALGVVSMLAGVGVAATVVWLIRADDTAGRVAAVGSMVGVVVAWLFAMMVCLGAQLACRFAEWRSGV